MKSLYLINTTYGWNPGDDLIREGVLRLLDIAHEPKVFINRGQALVDEQIIPMWKLQRNAEVPNKLARQAKALVIAGSPEWVRFAEEFYSAAVRYKLPIYLVGVGQPVPGCADALENAKHLIVGATVRDKYAAAALEELDIPYEWFPDPAFYAQYDQCTTKLDLVVNYRAKGGNGRVLDDFDDTWRAVARRYGKKIKLVTVHEQGEIERARKIFKAPVFFSSDYLDYKRIYSSTKRLIGGRIHGATPVLATGGVAHVFYNSAKIDALEQVATFMDTLTISRYEGVAIEELPTGKPSKSIARLKSKLEEHRQYWASRL